MTTDTFNVLLLPHIAALLAAIDEGDDEVLPILADALEEVGDGRAAGLRDNRLTTAGQPLHVRKGYRGSTGYQPAGGWQWYGMLVLVPTWAGDLDDRWRHVLPASLLERLQDQKSRDLFARHPTRSAAFLALAAALR